LLWHEVLGLKQDGMQMCGDGNLQGRSRRWLRGLVVLSLFLTVLSCRDQSTPQISSSSPPAPVPILIKADSGMFPYQWLEAPYNASAPSAGRCAQWV